jgi:hypothetical protein
VKTPYREAAELDTAPTASYLMAVILAVACDSETAGKFARNRSFLHVSGELRTETPGIASRR